MNNTMHYKGYTARVHFDAEDDIFWGEVENIRGSISFHADSVTQLHEEFKISIDYYLESCARLGKKPEKPRDTRLEETIAAGVYNAALAAAERAGKPLGQWVEALIARETGIAA